MLLYLQNSEGLILLVKQVCCVLQVLRHVESVVFVVVVKKMRIIWIVLSHHRCYKNDSRKRKMWETIWFLWMIFCQNSKKYKEMNWNKELLPFCRTIKLSFHKIFQTAMQSFFFNIITMLSNEWKSTDKVDDSFRIKV